MYERNAIVLERFFDDLFGNNEAFNLKDNFIKYDNLVECSAKYAEATDSEDKIMQEYEDIANRIKNIQKNQEILNQESVEFHEERNNIFQNIAEEPENIQKSFDKLNKKIDENSEKIRQNEKNFVSVISKFNEKSDVRNTLGKERKKVEEDYSLALNQTLESHRNMSKEKIKNARDFNENINTIEKELLELIRKNGEKEIVPFNNTAIKNAIKLDINIQKKIVEILCNGYEKTGRLFLEIKNNNIRIEKHRKLIRDSKAKLDFLEALKNYLIQFLDNERLTAVNGETEHKKQMKEACKNFEDDLIQINNLYELLLKEISSKANKKLYRELYNVQYLRDLENSLVEFEQEISKLHLLGTIINPNHWRIDAMQKIYEVFYKNVTDIYGRDLSEYIIKEEEKDSQKDEVQEPESSNNGNYEKESNIIIDEDKVEKSIREINNYVNEFSEIKDKAISSNELLEEDFDEKIDMILGFDKKDSIINNNKDEEKSKDVASDLSEYESTITDDEFWKEDNESEGLYKWDEDFDEGKLDDYEEWEDDSENDDYEDWEEDAETDDDEDWNEVSESNNQLEENLEKEDEEDTVNQNQDYKYEYNSYDETTQSDNVEDNNIYKDTSWDEEYDNTIFDKEGDIKNAKVTSTNRSIGIRNKKTKGKHNKKEEKSRGLFGKLLK